jgi:pimeloyl-ACP methyl ester carboxylesterase
MRGMPRTLPGSAAVDKSGRGRAFTGIAVHPTDRFIEANRLRHHLLEWSDTGPTVLLLHGFLEHAHAWDFVAPRIAAAGYRVLALDWRGHGDSEWIGRGGYYHFPDYAADLAGVVRALGGRVALVAHSMGAGGATLFAGTSPESVSALACIDALGPPDMDPNDVPRRYASWIADLDKSTARLRPVLTLADATARLRERFPHFPEHCAAHLALHGTRSLNGDADGARVWKFDPLHQTTAPTPFYVRQSRPFWQRITCPVLYVAGAKSPFRLAATDEADRLAELRAERVELADVGHHPHLEAPERLADLLVDFLRRSPCAD